MSNLKLDSNAIRNTLNGIGCPHRIGYATMGIQAYDSDGKLYNVITHHGNGIARTHGTDADSMELTHCGYNTMTTANRLRKIIYTFCGWHAAMVRIHKGRMIIEGHDGMVLEFDNGPVTLSRAGKLSQ